MVRHALKSKDEIERVYWEVIDIVPDFRACLAIVPDGQLRIFALHATGLAANICRKRGEQINEDRILRSLNSIIKSRKVSGVSPLFAYCFRFVSEVMLRSYLTTQYFYWKNLDRVNVDPMALYN